MADKSGSKRIKIRSQHAQVAHFRTGGGAMGGSRQQVTRRRRRQDRLEERTALRERDSDAGG